MMISLSWQWLAWLAVVLIQAIIHFRFLGGERRKDDHDHDSHDELLIDEYNRPEIETDVSSSTLRRNGDGAIILDSTELQQDEKEEISTTRCILDLPVSLSDDGIEITPAADECDMNHGYVDDLDRIQGHASLLDVACHINNFQVLRKRKGLNNNNNHHHAENDVCMSTLNPSSSCCGSSESYYAASTCASTTCGSESNFSSFITHRSDSNNSLIHEFKSMSFTTTDTQTLEGTSSHYNDNCWEECSDEDCWPIDDTDGDDSFTLSQIQNYCSHSPSYSSAANPHMYSTHHFHQCNHSKFSTKTIEDTITNTDSPSINTSLYSNSNTINIKKGETTNSTTLKKVKPRQVSPLTIIPPSSQLTAY